MQALKFPFIIMDNVKDLVRGWYRKELAAAQVECVHCLTLDSDSRYDPFVFSLDDIQITAAQGTTV